MRAPSAGRSLSRSMLPSCRKPIRAPGADPPIEDRPEGHGQTIAIVRGHHACPVKAVKAWLSAAGITEGPLFRPVAKGGRLSNQRLTDKRVCDIVKRRDGSAIADHQPKRLPCVNRFTFSEVIKV
jgi:hypothetical protein